MLNRKFVAFAAVFAATTPLFAHAAIAAPLQTPSQGSGQGYEDIQSLEAKAEAALKAGDYSRALDLAKKLLAANTDTKSWNYGNVVYSGNSVAGLAALETNDLVGAKKYLIAAGATPGSPQLNSFGPDMALARKLYSRGEKTTVLKFLDEVGSFWGNPHSATAKNPQFSGFVAQQTATLAQWKDQIKAGETPSFNCADLAEAAGTKMPGGQKATTAAPAEVSALLTAGTIAPDFVVSDRAGKPVHLSDYKGKVVVLDFWATWCPPCQASMPHTNEVAQKFASRNVVVLAVCTSDTQTAFDGWIPKHLAYDSITFAIDTAPHDKNVAHSLYNVSGIPTQYVIDGTGKIVKSFVGYGGPNDDLSNAIQQSSGVTAQ